MPLSVFDEYEPLITGNLFDDALTADQVIVLTDATKRQRVDDICITNSDSSDHRVYFLLYGGIVASALVPAGAGITDGPGYSFFAATASILGLDHFTLPESVALAMRIDGVMPTGTQLVVTSFGGKV